MLASGERAKMSAPETLVKSPGLRGHERKSAPHSGRRVGKPSSSMLESFFGGQQTRIKRRPYGLSVKRNRRLLVRLSPAVSCRAPRPEGDPAVRGEGQNVGVEESVVCRREASRSWDPVAARWSPHSTE